MFAKKGNIDIDKLKINMALKRNDLAWIGVNIKGTKAKVEIVPKVMPDADDLAGIACNIVAQKDGLITKIYARDGIAVVSAGDMVKKGQILISGVMSSEHSEDRYVHADGEVYAKTWYTNKAKIYYKRDVASKTGNIEKRCKIKIGKYEINFLNNDTNFKKYDTITVNKKFTVFNKFSLPIEVLEVQYEELDIETVELTKNQAIEIAKNQAMIGALNMIPRGVETIDNNVIVREFDGGVEAEVTVECIEKIGTKEKLGG